MRSGIECTGDTSRVVDVDLSRIRAGEQDAFEELLDATWDDLVAHLTWITGSRDVAEDVGQEAFIRLWEFRERWRDGSARALLFHVGRNLALDARRRARVRREWAEREDAYPPPAPGPDDDALAAEYETAFLDALAALAPGRREVIELVRMRGLTHREAAEALGVSVQTVANRMTLALADLRALLAGILPSLESPEEPRRSREANDG